MSETPAEPALIGKSLDKPIDISTATGNSEPPKQYYEKLSKGESTPSPFTIPAQTSPKEVLPVRSPINFVSASAQGFDPYMDSANFVGAAS